MSVTHLRSALEEIGGWSEEFQTSQDSDLSMRLLSAGYAIMRTPDTHVNMKEELVKEMVENVCSLWFLENKSTSQVSKLGYHLRIFTMVRSSSDFFSGSTSLAFFSRHTSIAVFDNFLVGVGFNSALNSAKRN